MAEAGESEAEQAGDGLTCERRWARWCRAPIHSPSGACHVGTPGWRGRAQKRLRTWAPRLAAAAVGMQLQVEKHQHLWGDQSAPGRCPHPSRWPPLAEEGSPAVMFSSLQALSRCPLSTSPTTMDCTAPASAPPGLAPPRARSRLPPGAWLSMTGHCSGSSGWLRPRAGPRALGRPAAVLRVQHVKVGEVEGGQALLQGWQVGWGSSPAARALSPPRPPTPGLFAARCPGGSRRRPGSPGLRPGWRCHAPRAGGCVYRSRRGGESGRLLPCPHGGR